MVKKSVLVAVVALVIGAVILGVRRWTAAEDWD
jgi:hypothetical protein